jgi:hypothetical protein
MQISEDLRQQACAERVRYLRDLMHGGKTMNSADKERGDIGTEQTAPAARRRARMRAMSNAAMTGWAGLAALVVVFFAAAGYFVFGTRYEKTSTAEIKSSVFAFVVAPALAGNAQPDANEMSSGDSTGPDYFPSAYPNRGRDGDGNVMTYEHD